jgi:hypothetical protein
MRKSEASCEFGEYRISSEYSSELNQFLRAFGSDGGTRA